MTQKAHKQSKEYSTKKAQILSLKKTNNTALKCKGYNTKKAKKKGSPRTAFLIYNLAILVVDYSTYVAHVETSGNVTLSQLGALSLAVMPAE